MRKSIDCHSKAATEFYLSSTFLVVGAISRFVRGFRAKALMPAVFAESASIRGLNPVQSTMGIELYPGHVCGYVDGEMGRPLREYRVESWEHISIRLTRQASKHVIGYFLE